VNQDTTPTPRTDSIISAIDMDAAFQDLCRQLERELAEKTNEVARLREELDRLKRGCQGSCYACEPVGEMNLKLEAEIARLREELKERIETQSTFALALLEKPEREVARLRELLNRAIEIADEAITPLQRSEYSMDGDMLYRQLERLRDEVARPAPATEEPANPTCSNTTHRHSYCDCKEPVSLDPAPKFTHDGNTDAKFKQCEWRELGPDEVIQEGDETNQRGSYDWGLCSKYFIGRQVWEFIPFHPLRSFRTRRPLPTTNHKQISSKLVDEPKHEEMPLEDDVASIEWSCDHTARAIRYLRDEIQKLKEV